MFCPKCGSPCEDSDRFCRRCGMPLSTIPEVRVSEPFPLSTESDETIVMAPPVPKKKGRLWPPLLIMGILVCLGLGLFFATKGMASQSREYPWFAIRDGALYFDESRYTGGPELTVPETVDGQTVIALGPGCFADCESLTTVNLPGTLITVGSDAFSGCTALRGILIPERVTTVGARAFDRCISLEAVCIPTTVNAIGSGAFDGCDSLLYILYPGAIRDWQRLYGEDINDRVRIYCAEGVYPHAYNLP